MAKSISKPENILNRLQALPPEQLKQVEDLIELLLQTHHPYPSTPDSTSLPPRVLGLQLDKGWMSDDFNAPLPDEFWLGEI